MICYTRLVNPLLYDMLYKISKSAPLQYALQSQRSGFTSLIFKIRLKSPFQMIKWTELNHKKNMDQTRKSYWSFIFFHILFFYFLGHIAIMSWFNLINKQFSKYFDVTRKLILSVSNCFIYVLVEVLINPAYIGANS